MNQFYTAESVTEGHPDKLCDIIADSVLDECLAHDALSRVACEVLATKGQVIVAGEITSLFEPDIPSIVHSVFRKAGYDPARFSVQCLLHRQSPDIAAGVDCSLERRRNPSEDQPALQLGAGDQGVMVGYACSETPQRMPLPVMLAHRLTSTLAAARKTGVVRGLRPDGKAQVTVEYGEDGKPLRLDTVVLSAQHSPEIPADELCWELTDKVLAPALQALPPDEDTKILLNPSGRFVLGGPEADTGLTGRNSWWTATACSPRTAAARFPAKIPPRWIVPGHTWPGTSPKTLWRRACAKSAKSRWPMPSGKPSRSWWRWIPSVPALSAPMIVWQRRRASCSA